MPHPSLALLQSALDLTRAQLRWELLNIAVGVILISLGAAAAALYFARRTALDLTLIYFGLFSALYGFRLLATMTTIQSLFPFSPQDWRYFDWFITCTIVLPLGLFLLSVATGRLRIFFRWMIGAQIAIAVLGMAAALLGANLARLYAVNNVLVLAIVPLAILFLLISRRTDAGPRKPLTREFKIFLGGFAIFMLFVVQVNVASLRVGPGRNLEFIGFFIFVCCLGYIAASRSFAREEQLVNINKELEIARQIQSSILPHDVPHLAGLEIAARYVPMSAVAGDFYDFLVVNDQQVGVLVADVSGHGVPAALIASMLKVAFAGQADHASDPARVLSGLNRALTGKFADHFVTAAYLYIDTEKKVARYAGAGHPPMLLGKYAPQATHSAPTEEVRSIEENGLMLGVFPDATFTAVEIPLRPGDRCLLYTDGLFEAANAAQEEFGHARLAQFLQARRDLPAALLADALLAEVSNWSANASSATRHDDDLTLVVLDLTR
ncbi:MAG TPA: PP2C family protein-serine/threonine phosphatase [Candidatus Acidoferrales bacterium]